MFRMCGGVQIAATKAPAQTGSKSYSPISSDQSGSESCGWFPKAASVLLGSDPGLALHLLTGCAERTGYRYASGERDPSAHVIASLLRSEHGWQWLSALMDGAQPAWWSDLRRARRVVAQLDAIDLT